MRMCAVGSNWFLKPYGYSLTGAAACPSFEAVPVGRNKVELYSSIQVCIAHAYKLGCAAACMRHSFPLVIASTCIQLAVVIIFHVLSSFLASFLAGSWRTYVPGTWMRERLPVSWEIREYQSGSLP
jgi:hypothetical protein